MLPSLAHAVLLGSLAAVVAGGAVGKPLFTMRERQASWAKQLCAVGGLAKDLSYSELSFFDGGEAEEWTWSVAACSNPTHALEWDRPAGSKLRKFRVAGAEYQRFKEFLDDPNVRRVESFMNAGPGVGDYELEVYRGSETQQIEVLSLMPDHFELRRDPTLLRLICAAKQVAHIAKPAWCPSNSERR